MSLEGRRPAAGGARATRVRIDFRTQKKGETSPVSPFCAKRKTERPRESFRVADFTRIAGPVQFGIDALFDGKIARNPVRSKKRGRALTQPEHVVHVVQPRRLAGEPSRRSQGASGKNAAIGGLVGYLDPFALTDEHHRVLADDVAA